MPSLSNRYKSADKAGKGKILDEVIQVTRGKYTTVRTRLTKGCFPYPDKVLLCDFYNAKMEELFPSEPAFVSK